MEAASPEEAPMTEVPRLPSVNERKTTQTMKRVELENQAGEDSDDKTAPPQKQSSDDTAEEDNTPETDEA
jgi:hypothetical protein